MDREEVIKWLKIMKANLNTFPEINCGKKIEALAEAIRLLKNEQSIDKIDCEHMECRNCTNHKYCDYESSSSENPNKSENPTSSDDCISRADALRVAKNEYLRGWHNALCKALREKYSIHCEEGNFSVIQEETITGLGLSMNCAAGKDVESYMSTIPRATPIPKGHWIKKYHADEDGLEELCSAECSSCHKRSNGYAREDGYGLKFMYYDFCPKCGSDNREVEE